MRVALAAALLGALTACSAPPSTQAERYAHWLAGDARGDVDAYARFLRLQGVEGVVSMPQLLTTARRWHRCDAPEFAVPPRSHWQAIVPTLQLIRELRNNGLLGDARIASAWRNETLNRCEGGSSRSRHVANNALDFDLGPASGELARLCRVWRTIGQARRFGLGYYDGRRIHIDTFGFRTWGPDYHRGTSRCVSVPP
ncbi:D-Ala-D-Ala carboxypeptidase family metallohydrolase [Lysobacter sp. LF1]|uniref:D-Ala-D-Ala carboxypeptidase family metallohydrolase n=1 Tax=Lysobacter stagni TaxID=3045172 RepID=A0ABT6XHI9_9GAMM|nr:D-Ala-D-Ala carboxypeptidase family metallohydrolase [Lysobacter sp. LF1]MDI9239240.1 D-Ala-D-Ala carboxypeptidase family metallohydrolase [Lysobacter sp. LF1]